MSQPVKIGFPKHLAGLFQMLRTSDWWESKFGPLFANIYSSALVFGITFNSTIPFIGFVLVALVPGAVFVSVLNDLTDLDEDRAAGKLNRLEGKPKSVAFILIALSILSGVVVCLFLSKVSVVIYVSAWIVFSLYSVAPIRLKQRGGFGVLCDAVGAYVLPQLFAVVFFCEWFQKDYDLYWLVLIGVWTFLIGLRGIISHQFVDLPNDEKAGVRTLVRNHDPAIVKKLVSFLVFPFEIIVMIGILVYTSNSFSIVLVIIYFALSMYSARKWKVRFRIIAENRADHIALEGFYSVYFPVSVLMTRLLPISDVWLLLLIHILFFGNTLLRSARQLAKMGVELFYETREFLLGY